ncbi:ABC transporter permease [Clostridium fallax]|uniref:Transport permease protein n=1 Tax=Clostridium fallax TaxID=1533 RepID=A0A1M4TW92_9CLOT|nr:ABC transporter permease [Clostridium fallax]SHE48567.1 ABC-2 type transporter [Clostridium fallax]SQB22367.1 ABC-type polysaccharide/polyol phosphate export system, permease component [Clostridium fallax]
MRFIDILRVLKAKMILKTKIFFRYPLNIFYFIVDPIIWISPFYFMSKSFTTNGVSKGFEAYTGSGNYIGFLVIGFMITAYSSAALWSLGFSLKNEMMEGVLESNWSTPVSKPVLMFSSTIFEFTKATIEVICTGLVCHFIFGFTINGEILKAILFLIPGIIALMGLGLIVASEVLIIKNANVIVDVSNALLNGFSGGYFPVQVFPKYLLPIAFAIPLTFMNDSLRAILIDQTPIIPLKFQFIFLIVFMIILVFLGNIIFRRIEKRCRDNGVSGY